MEATCFASLLRHTFHSTEVSTTLLHNFLASIRPTSAAMTSSTTKTAKAESINVSKIDDDARSGVSVVSSVTQGSNSTHSSAMVSLVKEQVNLVRNLTERNRSAAEELRRVKEEKRTVERECRRMQEQLCESKLGYHQKERSSHQDGGGTGKPLATATALGSIPEEWGAQFDGGGIWAPLQSPAGNAETASISKYSTRGGTPPPHFGGEWTVVPEAGPSPPGSPQSTKVRHFNKFVPKAVPVRDLEASKTSNENIIATDLGFGPYSTGPTASKTIPLATTDPAPCLVSPEKRETCDSRFWSAFAAVSTFLVPDFLVPGKGAAVKQAWREKVALCLIAVAVSALLVGGFGFLPLFLCEDDEFLTWRDIYQHNNGVLKWHREALTVIHGNIYNVKPLISAHTGGARGVMEYLGKDASRMFPRAPPSDLPEHCLDIEKVSEDLYQSDCDGFTALDELVGTPCHDFASGQESLNFYMGDYHRGTLAHTYQDLLNDPDTKWIIIQNKVIFPQKRLTVSTENGQIAILSCLSCVENILAWFLPLIRCTTSQAM